MTIVVLNFKSYAEAIGENSAKLAQTAKEVSDETGIDIIVAPQTADISRTAQVIRTVAQHIDPIKLGAGTGAQTAEAAKDAGAIGSLLNHSEKRISLQELGDGIKKLRGLGMLSIVCSQDADSSKEYASLNPDYIAVEPPELIGTGIAVSETKPSIVLETVKKIRAVNRSVGILCGAGISKGKDVSKAIELGVSGVLLASAFTKAKEPKKVLTDICNGFKL